MAKPLQKRSNLSSLVFAEKVSQQTVGIPMGTNCSSLLFSSFCVHTKRFSYSLCSQRERNSISVQSHLQVRRWCIVHKNREFKTYLDQMYPAKLEIKDTTEGIIYVSYIDLQMSIVRDGQLHTSIYNKRYDFNCHIINFLLLSSNIPSSPAFLSLSLHDTPRLAPRMNILFRGPGDFPVSYQTGIPRRTLEIVIQEVLW